MIQTKKFDIVLLLIKRFERTYEFMNNEWLMIIEADNFDETYGINVQFEESDDDEEEDQYGEVKEDMDIDEDEEHGEEATVSQMLSANVSVTETSYHGRG